jgi:ArsR family transcriptional regulator
MTRNEENRSRAVSDIFKALGHPSRIFIVETLQKSEHCVCELSEMIGSDMSTVSRHLSVLKKAGIIRDRKEGTTVYYSLSCDCFKQMLTGAQNIIRGRAESEAAALQA